MRTALIIEDEPFAQQELHRLLKLQGGVKVLAEIETVKEAVQWLNGNPAPDLVFLDIQLADGLSFEIFEAVDLDVPVIFTTAYDEYAIRAFKLNSIDYLLKPIHEEDLKRAMEKMDRLDQPAVPWEQLNRLLDVDKADKSYRERFISKRGDKLVKIDCSDVVLLRAEDDMVWLMDRSGKEYIIDHSLETIEQELDPSRFFRISRSQIVALNAITQAHKYFNGRLKLDLQPDPEVEVLVSRSKYKDFLNWFGW